MEHLEIHPAPWLQPRWSPYYRPPCPTSATAQSKPLVTGPLTVPLMGHLQCCVCPNSQSGPTPLSHIGAGHFPSPVPHLPLGSLNRCQPAPSLFPLSPEKGALPPPRHHAEHRPSFPPIHPLATVTPSLALVFSFAALSPAPPLLPPPLSPTPSWVDYVSLLCITLTP